MMQLHPPSVSLLSETDWLLQFDTGLSIEHNKLIHTLAGIIRSGYASWVSDTVVAYDSLLIRLHKPYAEVDKMIAAAFNQLEQENTQQAPGLVEIPVCYDPALSNDLASMARQTGLQAEEIVHLHSDPVYHIYMLGFLPGFAYMGTVAPSIALPRKKEPVPVKTGAVGIAATQTGIYPTNSPGGWNIVGYTPLVMFNAQREPACILSAGQQVKFVPISFTEFESLQRHEHHH
ncbi:MAG TPA: 5-oxoprolinase subunit PxpB [Phnomibacter sp.]|nr:5-oxoprolinase subunit PxpB [Phnomibacter sp.]